MDSKYRGMSDKERWVLYHQLCDEWMASRKTFDEREFQLFVAKLTKDMGL